MQMRLDGANVDAQSGQSLLHMVKQLGLDSEIFSERPLAAKLAGEVFNLNYIPVRSEADADPATMRRAMQASGGEAELIRYTDPSGKDIYARIIRIKDYS